MSITSSNTFFENIIQNIMKMSNDQITIRRDSSLIKYLEDYVFKYYERVFDLVIPKMKVVIDNYNRFILNESRYLEISKLLNEKAIKEIN